MKEKGFILLGMLFMMVLVAVTAVALNRRAGLQARMAANDTEAVQTAFGQEAAIEDAVWQLTQNPCWRVNGTFTFHGIDYTRKVKSSTVAGHTDAVTIAAEAPGASKAMWATFRYYIHSIETPFLVIQPSQVCCDGLDHIYFADPLNHTVWKLNGNTGALTKVAGNGTSGFSGDGGPATSAQLDKPEGVCVDGWGNIYIGDTENHRIRKVSLSGNISTVAGTGSHGYNGDGGLAINAELNKPNGVFVDPSGSIFIADTDNHCIRKVDAATKIISTVAGIGGSEGDTGNGGQATSAKLKKPRGVFVDTSGDIYIADTENCWIRKVDVSTGNISRVAGNPAAQCGYMGDGGPAFAARLNKPRGVFVDAAGNVFIADTENHRIRLVDGATGDIDTLAGTGTAGYAGDGGLATNAELDSPRGVCLNGAGEMVTADTMNSCLREVDLGGIISTITGTGAPVLDHPRQLAMDAAGNAYIADTDNERVRKLDTSGWITTVAGTGSGGYNGDGIQATSAELKKPGGVSVAPSGNFYIADTDNHRIRMVEAATSIMTTYAGTGSGGYDGDGAPATTLKLNHPSGVAVSEFLLEIADTDNHRIREVDGTGTLYTIAGNGSGGYSGDGGLAVNAELKKPHAVFLDEALNIFIADTENHCIRRVDASSLVITTVAGTPETSGYAGDGGAATAALLKLPEDVFVDAAGNIFIADTENHVIRMVCAHDGTIRTLAGDGSRGYNGDDLPAVTAELNKPAGIVMAATRGGRKIFISDQDNDRLRLLTLEPVPEIPY